MDPQDYFKDSDSLKQFVSKHPKTEPPDRVQPDLNWRYLPEILVTEILRVVSTARQNITNAVNDMESCLQMYSGEVIGNIATQIDSMTREEIKFSEKVQEIRSTLTSSYETEFGNLVYRNEPEPE